MFILSLVLLFGGFSLPACQTEDSNDCYWSAKDQGNGKGKSFITINHRTFYLG